MNIKPVVGFPDYFISDTGRIFSTKPFARSTKRPETPRELRPALSKGYYGCSLVGEDGKSYYKTIHRMVLEAFVGPCPEGMEAAHNDGDRLNNDVSNLRWTTHKENIADKKKHGTCASITGAVKGSKHGRSKLTEEQVLEIRKAYAEGTANQPQLAAKYGVSQPIIHHIIHRTLWDHV